ncbi:MAG: zinc-dependent metalloprotease [Corynebacteriales bacterium]|nr:zinc-dependent metalloprotease [Mycobacteriales bacterium]
MNAPVDWNLAFSAGKAVVKTGPRVSPEEAAALVRELRVSAHKAAGHVAEFSQLDVGEVHPPVRVVDRVDWLEANISGLRQAGDLLFPQEGHGLFRAVSAKATALQAGTVLAYMSGRVLGQFDVLSRAQGQLLLVAPNIVDVERKLAVNPRDFRLWVCLHEVCHRTQFSAVPWLRSYFLDQIGQFIKAGQDSEGASLERAAATLAQVIRHPESRSSVLDAVTAPEQRPAMDRLVALMTLLEGHADFVMDGVGPQVVPSVDSIRAKFNLRRQPSNPLTALLQRLLGVEAKLRQYAEGRAFVAAVVERTSIVNFNQIWASPETLPTPEEIEHPEQWVARVS